MLATQPAFSLDAQPLTAANPPGNRLACIRQLGHLSIYADPQAERFFLVDGNVSYVFSDLMQALQAAMRAHAETIDRQNRQFLAAEGRSQAPSTH